MKKLLSFLLVFSIFIPTIWAYDLTDKDKVIVLRASTAIEKMITRKGESYRAKYVVALQKLQLRFQNNPRMQKIIGETANVLSDDTSGLENIFTTADASVNSPVIEVPKKEPVSEIVAPVKNETQNVAVVNQVTVRKCYMENGEGQETYSNNTWGSCNIVSCANSLHKEGNSCIANQLSCSIESGVGYKSWNGGWSSCNINQCNSGFEQLNNKCLQKCSLFEHREGDACVGNKISCDVENGKGEKEWKNGTWSACRMTRCSDGYDVVGGYVTTEISNETVLLPINNKCEKIYINIKLINTKSAINSSSDVIASLYIDTNLPTGSLRNLYFTDASNSKIFSYPYNIQGYSTASSYVPLLGRSTLIDGKIFFDSLYLGHNVPNSNLEFYKELKIRITSDIKDEDKGKIQILSIDKNSLQVSSGGGMGPYFKHDFVYGIDKINITEE